MENTLPDTMRGDLNLEEAHGAVHSMNGGITPSRVHLWIALAAITLFKPIFYSGRQHLMVGSLALVVGFICLSMLLRRSKAVFHKAAISAMAFWVLLKTWQIVPFREYNSFGFGETNTIMVLLFLLLNDQDKFAVLIQIRRAVAVLSALSFAVVALLAMGLDLPHMVIEGGVRSETGMFFYVYPGAIVLSSQVFTAFWGGTLVRSSGIFVEPGHFGVICGLLTASYGFSFRSTQSKLILLGGLSTFSGAYLGVLFFGLLFSMAIRAASLSVDTLKLYALIGCFLALLAASFLFSPAEFQDRVLWKRLSNVYDTEDLLEARASDYFNEYYSQFRTSAKSWIGIGTQSEFVASDWRAEVVRYGWVIFLLYFLLLLSLLATATTPMRIIASIMTAVLMIASHRIGYMDTFLVMSIVSATLVAPVRRHGGRIAGGADGKDREPPPVISPPIVVSQAPHTTGIGL